MAQYIYPDGDVTTDSWTTTPLFEKIDEGATPADGDYIQGPASVGGTSEVSLANPASAPTGSTATVRIRVAVNKTNKSGTMIVRLREGTTQRGASATLDAQVDFAAASTFYDFNFSATSIGNYDNLNIQFDQVTATGGNFFMVSWAECETPDGAPGGTNFTQDVAGSFSAVGTYSFLLSAARTGQASFNADIARQISKSFVGSATLNGTVARRVATSLVGSFDGTGDVAAKSVTRRTVTGILGQSGAVVRQTAHTLSGSLSATGAVARQSTLYRILSGALTFAGDKSAKVGFSLQGIFSAAGAISLKVKKLLSGGFTFYGGRPYEIVGEYFQSISGAFTFSGQLSRSSTLYRTFTGVLGLTGAAAKGLSASTIGSLAMSGSLVRKVSRTLYGAQTFSGALARVTARSLAGALTFAATVGTEARRSLTGTLTMIGALSTKRTKALTGILSATGAVGVTVRAGLAGVLTFAADLASQSFGVTKKSVLGSFTFASTLVRSIATSRVGAFSPAGAITSSMRRAVSGAFSFAGSIATTARVSLAGVFGFTGQTGVSLFKSLGGVLSLTGSISRTATLARVFTGVLTFTAEVASAYQGLTTKAVAGAMTLTGALSRHTSRSLAGAFGGSGSLIRKTYTSLAGVWSATGELTYDLFEFTAKAIAGSLTFAGTLSRTSTLARIFTGALTFTAELGTAYQGLTSKSVAGVLTASGSILRSITRSLVGVVDASATVSKEVPKAPGGLLSYSGNVVAIKLSPVSDDMELQWDLYELIGEDLALDYDIRELVAGDSVLTWDIRQLVKNDLEARYDILLNVAKSVALDYDIREAVGDNLAVIYDVSETIGKISTLVYSILRLEEPPMITKNLRSALLADLGQITTANGYNTTLLEIGKYPKPLREARSPCVFITEGGGGESTLETIANKQGLASQSFSLIAAVQTADGPDAMDDLLDDIRNAIEKNNSSLYDLAIVATVDTWGEILTDRDVQGEIYWRPLTVRCEYAYNRGTA
jgi:hypothetical protein